MTDYAWFALKGISYVVIIGVAILVTESALPLLALLLMPSWTKDPDCSCAERRAEPEGAK